MQNSAVCAWPQSWDSGVSAISPFVQSGSQRVAAGVLSRQALDFPPRLDSKQIIIIQCTVN
jgi:hypothetical protein